MINPFTHRKLLKRGRPGRAMIVEMGALDRGGTSFNLPMTLQVHVEGITPYEVEDQWMVKAKDTVALSGWIPVKVDPDEPEKVAIDWEPLRERYEQEKAARRDALAQGHAFTGANVTIGEPTVINLNGDPQGADQIQQMLASMGFGADVQQQAAAAYEQATAQPAPEPDDDDVIGKLERLAALRASGALTDAEFEQQKRRLLGG
jgi:hypothetical protein